MSEKEPSPAESASAASTVVLPGRRRWLRRAAWAIGIVLALVVPLAIRVGIEGRAELRAARQARAEGDLDLEIELLGRAARWRMPGLGHDEEAIARLLEIGREQEARPEGGTSSALAAYREARRALLATRVLDVPDRDAFDEANDRIATLMTAQEERFGTNVSGSEDPYAYHLALLDTIPGPSPVRGSLAALAFVAWLGTVAGFVLRCLDARGRLRSRSAVRWGAASLALLVAWAVLLRHAGGDEDPPPVGEQPAPDR